MYKLLFSLMGEMIMKKVKTWLIENGFVGFLALAVAGVAMFLGWWDLFWASIGGFAGKNWEIIRNLPAIMEYKEKIKDKFDNFV